MIVAWLLGVIAMWPTRPPNRLARAWWYPPTGVDKHEWFAAMREVEECSPDFGDEVPPGGRRTPEIERLARALDAYQQSSRKSARWAVPPVSRS